MRSGFRLLPLFLRRGSRGHDLTALALTAAGVAVATTVALLVLALRPGLDARDDRAAWREPTAARSEDRAPATQVRSTDIFEGDLIDRVDLAPSANGSAAKDLPAPPGLSHFPRPGEVYVSPALARLLDDQPASRLGDRFPGDVVGEIDAEGLAHEDELVAVVGHGAGDLMPGAGGERYPLDERTPDSPSPVTAIDGFARSGTDPNLEAYRLTSVIGAVVLTMPALLLIGSAARLTAARRNQRLAALRLAGATPGTVVTLTVAETAAAAAVGAVVGIVAYLAALPVMAQIPFAGGPWTASDLWLGWAPVLMAVMAAPVLAALCAAVALRQVVISPLGVAQRVRTRRPRSVRLLGMAGAWLFLAMVAPAAGSDDIAPVALGVAAVIGSLALVGPWVTWAVGSVFTRLARRPSTMLAARRILDDPKAAYRSVSGIVLAGLFAGFLFTMTPTINQLDDGLVDRNTMEVWLDGADPALVGSMEDRIAAAGLEARVEREDFEYGTTVLSVTPEAGTDREELRTALTGLTPEQPLIAPSDDVFGDATLLDDFRRASLMIAVAAVILAAATTAIASSASILDQRVTLRRLRLAGTPVSTLQRARAWQTMLPMVAATAGSVLSGMGGGLLLLSVSGSGSQAGTPDLLGLGAVIGFGVLLALLAGIVTRPLLESSTRLEAVA